jgi:hypothetical protein
MWKLIRGAILIVIFLALNLFAHNHPGDMIATLLAAIGALSICLGLYWYSSLYEL